MSLVLYSPNGVDQMLEMARVHFSSVPNKGLDRVTFSDNPRAFPPDHLQKLVRHQSVKQSKSLVMYFILPSFKDRFRANPLHVLSHVLGHEGCGSLLSELIRQGLAFELYCGPCDWLDMFTSFEVTLQLTEEGFREYQKVCLMVLEFVRLVKLKGVFPYILDQIKNMRDLAFRFRNAPSGLQKSLELAKNTLDYPAKHMNDLKYLFEGCTVEMVREASALLDAKNLLLFLSSPETTGDEEEPIYKVKYGVEDFPLILLEGIKRLDSFEGKVNVTIPKHISKRYQQSVYTARGQYIHSSRFYRKKPQDQHQHHFSVQSPNQHPRNYLHTNDRQAEGVVRERLHSRVRDPQDDLRLLALPPEGSPPAKR